MGAIFSDQEAVRGCSIDIFELDDVGMTQLLQYFYLVLEHLEAGRGILFQIYYLQSELSFLHHAFALVNLARIARTDQSLSTERVATNRLALLLKNH